MTHKAFFGDKERAFALTPELIIELERKTGIGIAAFCNRVFRAQFHFTDILETIRLGLIGGGTSSSDAEALVDAYAKPRPIVEILPLAIVVLETVWFGSPTTTDEPAEAIPQDEIGHAAAIDDALNQVAP
ncbi:gene transfer agent family protein [Phyllobacterium zundukense]|uniref:Gene transfer agent family protein n=1 Tax=Phyllobacterium zundukense TaxID=1867719 RepID=A0ACD4D7E6_9HYPH|nr:gene transfer agent family protein [Phyllobacterium zundukense]UXN61727.1 gene transfer agent family protein [Phyllobacterium zundukense]